MTPDELNERFKSWQDAIKVWLQEATNVDVLFAEQSDPRAYPPFIAFRFLTGLVRQDGVDETRVEEDPDDANEIQFRHIGNKNITVSITAHGVANDPDNAPGPVQILTSASIALNRERVRQKLRAAGLGVIAEGTPGFVPFDVESEIEPRAVMDVIFSTIIDDVERNDKTSEDDTIIPIESVEFQGDFDSDGDGNADDVSTGVVTVPEP